MKSTENNFNFRTCWGVKNLLAMTQFFKFNTKQFQLNTFVGEKPMLARCQATHKRCLPWWACQCSAVQKERGTSCPAFSGSPQRTVTPHTITPTLLHRLPLNTSLPMFCFSTNFKVQSIFCFSFEWMNELMKIYHIWCIKTSTQNRACFMQCFQVSFCPCAHFCTMHFRDVL